MYRLRASCLAAVLTLMLLPGLLIGCSPVAAADAPLYEPARREALEGRLKQIDSEQKASANQYAIDKKACSGKILVSRCTSDALMRRRSRDEVLAHAQTAARTELRALGVASKNRALATSLPGGERDREAAVQRTEALRTRAAKMADVQERRAGHERKKAQEAENRAAWAAKQARSQQKQADAQAKRVDMEAKTKRQGVTAGHDAGKRAGPGLKASVN